MIEDENNSYKKSIEGAINTDEFTRTHNRILNRFSIFFTKKVNLSPMYHEVYCMLQQGVDEYQIIEELLQKNEQLSNDIVKLNQNRIPKYYKE